MFLFTIIFYIYLFYLTYYLIKKILQTWRNYNIIFNNHRDFLINKINMLNSICNLKVNLNDFDYLYDLDYLDDLDDQDNIYKTKHE